MYEANAQAIRDSELITIEKTDLEDLIFTYPEIAIRMLADFGNRIKRLKNFAAEIALIDVTKRIKRLLLELVCNSCGNGENTIILSDIPTQDEMAFRIGTVREVLCMGLHKLEKDNLIKVKRGKVVIYDIRKLKESISPDGENLFPITLPMKEIRSEDLSYKTTV